MKTSSTGTFCLSLIASALFSSAAIADASGDDTMVVTASGFEQAIRNAPASINVITRAELEKKPFNSLADAVKDIEGISVSGSNSNEQDISIRGMPGQYTLILVDGKRQNTRETRPNGSGGYEASFIPPLQAIERIEVIRGPMSSLYGSDAIGGVINVITRKVSSEWNAAVGLDSTLQENADSGNIYQGNVYVSGPLVEDKLGLQLYGKSHYRPEDEIINGHNKKNNQSFAAKLAFTPNENHDIILDAGRDVQKREETPGKSIGNYTIRGGLKQPNPRLNTEVARDHWALSHTGRWGFGVSELSFSQEDAKRTTETYRLDSSTGEWSGGTDTRKPEIKNSVLDAKLTLPLPMSMLTLGAQYQDSRLRDDSATGKGTAAATSVEVNQYALFAENELSLTDDLILTGGVRFDDHEVYGNHWSPRGYLVYHLSEEVTLRGGISTAFRAPSLREISPRYGLATQGGAGIIYGNPDLNPETSTSQEIGISYDHPSGFNAALTLFNNDFKNKLISYNTGEQDPITGLNLWTYGNVGKANIKGVETSTKIPLAEDWQLNANYTYMDSKRESDDEFFTSGVSLKGQPLAQTPKHSANAKLDWQVSETLSAYTRMSYTGKQIWAAQRNNYTGPRYRSGYTTVDVGGSYQVNKDTQLNFAVLNLADKTQDVDTEGGNWVIEDGRRYWAGVNVQF